MDLMLIDLLESSKAIGLCPMGKRFLQMVIVSHDVKLNVDSVCSVTGGDNADRIIFRLVNLNTEFWCFFLRKVAKKFIGYRNF